MSVSTDVRSTTAPYRLLGHPTDLQGHVAALGRIPIPSTPHRHWRGEVVTMLEKAGLGGRGGAAFPAAIKLAVARAGGKGGLVVVNGMEGEPASDKDKVLLLKVPHLVLDGAQVLAAATAASEVVICLPPGRRHIADAVGRAVDERAAAAFDAVPLRVAHPPDRFIAGEESALAQWLAVGASLPTFRPNKGTPLRIGRQVALVHNTETLAHIGMIIRGGPESFRSRGLAEEPGTTLVTLSGAVQQPGVVEVDRGTPLHEIVARATPARSPSAMLVGGYGGTWVGPEHFGTPYASLALRTIGASAGVGIIAVLDQNSCGLAETARIAHYMSGQSAGQCGPCVFGLPAITDDLTRLARGQVDPGLLARLERRLFQVNGRGACRHPDGVVTMVRSALSVFASDVMAHAHGAPCDHLRRPTQLRFPAGTV